MKSGGVELSLLTVSWLAHRMEINMFDGMKILIWGYGREGKSTENFLKRVCNPKSVEIFEGKREKINEVEYDLIIKSPGIVMDEDNPKFTSQTEIFLEKFKDNVVGVTGTKGKSTTSSMLFFVLSKCLERPVLLLGNIGNPCLDYYDTMTNDTIVVFEMSCHQLRYNKFSPHISVFLNLFEEHLDYYKTVDKYFEAKSSIAIHQKKGDFFYVGSEVPNIYTEGSRISISPDNIGDYVLSIEGEHNKYNAEFVYRIATERYGCNKEQVLDAISEFNGLSHRLEYVASMGDVRFFDDSISTIPEASISALLSIKDAKTILIGGMDRGIDYSKLIEFIKNHKEYNYICMYASGKRIYEALDVKSFDNVYFEEDLDNSVKKAIEITASGTIILSPAAASYGYFENFEKRGEAFKEIVEKFIALG